jgi:hypothetical protein
MKDWAEVKMGVRAILLFLVGLFGVWVFASSRYPLNDTAIAARQNWAYGIVLGIMLAWLLFAYWKQEQAHQKVTAAVSAH